MPGHNKSSLYPHWECSKRMSQIIFPYWGEQREETELFTYIYYTLMQRNSFLKDYDSHHFPIRVSDHWIGSGTSTNQSQCSEWNILTNPSAVSHNGVPLKKTRLPGVNTRHLWWGFICGKRCVWIPPQPLHSLEEPGVVHSIWICETTQRTAKKKIEVQKGLLLVFI